MATMNHEYKNHEYKNHEYKNHEHKNRGHSAGCARQFSAPALSAIIIVISLLIGIPLLSAPAEAAAIGVNKAVMDFRNVLRGGYAQDTVFVTTDTEMDVPVYAETLGDFEGWVSFENETFTISRDRAGVLIIKVHPPADIPSGNYAIDVRLVTGSLTLVGGRIGSNIQAAFIIRLNVQVIGDQIVSCSIGGVDIQDIEKGFPLDLRVTVLNGGNVRITPEVQFDIWNTEQTRLVDTETLLFGSEILPTTPGTLSVQVQNALDLGQYWADVSVPMCGPGKSTLTFDVLEKGAIADRGEFDRIDMPFEAAVGQIVPVTAVFKNLGTRFVSAKFKGSVYVGERVVAVIETDALDVAPGETAKIQTFYTPREEGHHVLKGRILYNSKLTSEQEAFMDVYPAAEKKMSVVLLVVVIVIILLLLLIIRRRRQQRRRIMPSQYQGHPGSPPSHQPGHHPGNQYRPPLQPPQHPGHGGGHNYKR